MAYVPKEYGEARPEKMTVPERSDRRDFLVRSAALGAGLIAPAAANSALAAEAAPELPTWSKAPGTPMRTYGTPSRFEEPVKRVLAAGYPKISPGTGSSLT